MEGVKVTPPDPKAMLDQYRAQSPLMMGEQVKGFGKLKPAERIELLFYIMIHQTAIIQRQQAAIEIMQAQAAKKPAILMPH